MDHSALDRLLREAYAARPLSRSEKRAITAAVEDLGGETADLAVIRHAVFDLARREAAAEKPEVLLEWLEDMVKILDPGDGAPAVHTLVFFSPGDDCRHAIVAALRNARSSADLCVFTISDDYLSEQILAAHKRRVAVRIITDDDKALDSGSDIGRLHRAGIPVKIDDDPDHMHHKFAVFDGKLLLTGSYNWTRSAAERNAENILQTDAPAAVSAFAEQFAALWQRMPAYRG
jgi:phosphatidylserine/phosphatidylglycerophosphate/cardiolipin synthase-like enzyme